MILVVCGVSGAGKTTVGTLLSDALSIPFFDADDFHPAKNIEKMCSGTPLEDEDRRPWLEMLAGKLAEWETQGGAVLACSALKESYRAILASQCGQSLNWIFLHGPEDLLADRLILRQGHFFDKRLLESQLISLEIPDYGWLIDVNSSPEETVKMILERLQSE